MRKLLSFVLASLAVFALAGMPNASASYLVPIGGVCSGFLCERTSYGEAVVYGPVTAPVLYVWTESYDLWQHRWVDERRQTVYPDYKVYDVWHFRWFDGSRRVDYVLAWCASPCSGYVSVGS